SPWRGVDPPATRSVFANMDSVLRPSGSSPPQPIIDLFYLRGRRLLFRVYDQLFFEFLKGPDQVASGSQHHPQSEMISKARGVNRDGLPHGCNSLVSPPGL